NPSTVVEPAAQRLFVGMLFTEWCWKLAKCRNKSCDRYYLLNKVRPVYKRGTMCAHCNSRGSATRRVLQLRAEQFAERLRLAAAARKRWLRMSQRKQQVKGGNAKEYIAKSVNTDTAFAPVTVKW